MQTAVARGAAYHALTLSRFGRGLFQPAAHDDIAIRTSSGLVPLIARGAPLPACHGASGARCELAVPETTIFEPCRLQVELVGGEGDRQRSLFSGTWHVPGPVSKGDPLVLTCELDENQVLSLELRLGDNEDADPFTLTIENPLTHVSNPLRERLQIDEREEALRARTVPAESIPDTLVELADGYRELGHHEKALDYLRRALTANGRPDVDILIRMGIICGTLGDASREEKFYREAAGVSTCGAALFNLALAQFNREAYRAASETIRQALERTRSAAYLVLAGRIAAAERRTGDRDTLLREARTAFPPPSMMDDYSLAWATSLAQLLPDEAFFKECDLERQTRRRAGASPGGPADGRLPDVRGSLVRAAHLVNSHPPRGRPLRPRA